MEFLSCPIAVTACYLNEYFSKTFIHKAAVIYKY